MRDISVLAYLLSISATIKTFGFKEHIAKMDIGTFLLPDIGIDIGSKMSYQLGSSDYIYAYHICLVILGLIFLWHFQGLSCLKEAARVLTSTALPICLNPTPTSLLLVVKTLHTPSGSVFSLSPTLQRIPPCLHLFKKNHILTWQGLACISLVFTAAQTSRKNALSIDIEIGFANVTP